MRSIRIASIVLTLLIVSLAPVTAAGIHPTNGVQHGGNLQWCEGSTCGIHSHTYHSTPSYKVADFWSPMNDGYFYDCFCDHAHHLKNVHVYWACNWDAANSSAKPYMSYHTHGNICG
jgi:hypothetical protein